MNLQFLNYFFVNNSKPQKSFWNKDFRQLLHNNSEFIQSSDNCICLYKKGNIFGKYIQRFYSIQGTYLVYGDNDLKGFKKLDNVYLFLEETKNSTYPYQIKLMHDRILITLYSKSQEEFLQFTQELKSKCILTNFYHHYQIIKQIGFGSTASVFISKSQIDQQLYAIKRIKKKTKINPGFLLEEISIMRELSHPNILKLYQVFETNQHVNMVLELIEGGELLKFNRYTIKEARIIAKQLALSVDYMHQKGIMHRDLKPQNILCKQNSLDIIIADFGLATTIKGKNHFYYRCGTTGYVAPEVVQYKDGSKMYSEKCDIFSLGVIFYQLFFNQHPFKDNDKKNILKRNINVEFKFDDQIKVSQSCKDLISSMLRQNPKQRPTAIDILRHSFFNEQLLDIPVQTLTTYSIQLQESQEKKSQSSSFQQGDVIFSSIYMKKFEDEIDKQNDYKKEDHQDQKSSEFKELSPIWTKKVEISKINSMRQKASSFPLQKQLGQQESRSHKGSLYRKELKQSSFSIFQTIYDINEQQELDEHHSPYIHQSNMLLRHKFK